MKNVLKTLVIIGIAALIGLAITACENETECEHIWDWIETTPPTETEPAEETKTCTICRVTDGTREGRPATGSADCVHTWGELIQTTDPTCTTDGEKTQTCTKCPAVNPETVTVQALGHEGIGAILPTCTTAGNTGEGTCTRCSQFVTGETIDALNHDFPAYIPPTCTADGIRGICKRENCNVKEEGAEETALGHAYPEWTAPTCTTAGNSTRTCTRQNCGHEDTRTEGFAELGHDDGEWHITKPATADEDGERELRCTRCQFVIKTEVIPKAVPQFWWGNYIPGVMANGEEAWPQYGMHGVFDINELVNTRNDSRWIGRYEEDGVVYEEGMKEVKFSENAVKAPRQINFVGEGSIGFLYFIAPTDFGNIIVRDAANAIVTGTWEQRTVEIDGMDYNVVRVRDAVNVQTNVSFTFGFPN